MKTSFLIRTLLGILGAVLVFLSPTFSHIGRSQSEITGLLVGLGVMLSMPTLLGGAFGAIVSYWKRRFGGVFMLLAGLWGFIPSFTGGYGWGFLGSFLLIGCAISSFWHRLD